MTMNILNSHPATKGMCVLAYEDHGMEYLVYWNGASQFSIRNAHDLWTDLHVWSTDSIVANSVVAARMYVVNYLSKRNTMFD